MIARVTIVALALAFSAVRIAGYTEVHVGRVDVFQPHVHLFVGVLIGLAVAAVLRVPPRFAGWLAAALMAVEVACFALGVGGRS